MYKLQLNLNLAPLGHWVCKNAQVHDHFTRASNRYHQRNVRTTHLCRTSLYKNMWSWNYLALRLTTWCIYNFL